MRAVIARWLFRLVAAAVIVGALAYIPYRVYGSEGYVHYRALRREEAELARDNAALRAENQALRSDVRRLRDDPEAVATVARDELGMVAPDELVIQIDRIVAPGAGSVSAAGSASAAGSVSTVGSARAAGSAPGVGAAPTAVAARAAGATPGRRGAP